MTGIAWTSADGPTSAGVAASVPTTAARVILMLAVGAGIGAGLLATGGEASSHAIQLAGADLTRLLRAMALLKAVMAVAATAAILWRLGVAATPTWLSAYAIACAAMAAGPGLIWDMSHVSLGALLLHGGLVAALLLLWRDPAVGMRLSALVANRRAALR